MQLLHFRSHICILCVGTPGGSSARRAKGAALAFFGLPSSPLLAPGGLTVEQASAAIDTAVASAVESGDAGVIMGMMEALVSVPIARCSEGRRSPSHLRSPSASLVSYQSKSNRTHVEGATCGSR